MKHKRTILIVTTVLYMAAISYFSLKPAAQGAPGNVIKDVLHNALHAPAYGLLFYLILNSVSGTTRNAYLFSFATAVSFGVLNEYLQSFVPGRCSSFGDVLVNVTGVLIAIAVCRRKGRKGSGLHTCQISRTSAK